MIPLALLDLCPIVVGSDASQALRNSLDLAQHAEKAGYSRFWLAEHHNMPGIASAATAVVIGHIAAGTKTLRVGAGGIMLPNHAPLVVAEQFGTLDALFPGRIDLGLGRAPGTDQPTARALRRSSALSAQHFPEDVAELLSYFKPATAATPIRAVPGAGADVPVWLLGSSLFSAQLAAKLGLPFAFASHFAPAELVEAFSIYRSEFRPSERLAKPHAMLAFNAFVADTDREAKRLFSSVQQQFAALRRGTPGPTPPPVDDIDAHWTPYEAAAASSMLACSAVGAPDTVGEIVQELVDSLAPDELMATSLMYDHQARVRSFDLLANVVREIRPAQS
jgi:luciferase family oxidoreductase group 1